MDRSSVGCPKKSARGLYIDGNNIPPLNKAIFLLKRRFEEFWREKKGSKNFSGEKEGSKNNPLCSVAQRANACFGTSFRAVIGNGF